MNFCGYVAMSLLVECLLYCMLFSSRVMLMVRITGWRQKVGHYKVSSLNRIKNRH